MPYIILVMFFQLLAVIHIMRTGRERYWVTIVVFFSAFGITAYVIAEIIPGFLASYKGQKLQESIIIKINPTKEIKKLKKLIHQTPTTHNKQKLAMELLLHKKPQESLEIILPLLAEDNHYDSEICYIAARALFDLGDHAKALGILEKLFSKDQNLVTEDLQLIYALCLANCGKIEMAFEIFNNLYNCSNDIRIGYFYVQTLLQNQEIRKANELIDNIEDKFRKTMHPSNKSWLKELAILKKQLSK